jgi:hypothetical protein
MALISNMITKARDKVKAFYGFANDQGKVKTAVEWLMEDGHFVFGTVDIEASTFHSCSV